MKTKFKGGFLVTVGYILSPLSWWNDAFINIPIAYGFAFLFGLISEKLFLPMIIFMYWVTNILGFIMIHYGAKNLILEKKSKYMKLGWAHLILISTCYTMLIFILIKIDLLNSPYEYLK